jgi:hypothetical protein
MGPWCEGSARKGEGSAQGPCAPSARHGGATPRVRKAAGARSMRPTAHQHGGVCALLALGAAQQQELLPVLLRLLRGAAPASGQRCAACARARSTHAPRQRPLTHERRSAGARRGQPRGHAPRARPPPGAAAAAARRRGVARRR